MCFSYTNQMEKLTIIAELGVIAGRGRRPYVRVRCFCGAVFDALQTSIRTGNTTSCGCRRRVSLIARNTTHGMAPGSGRHPMYGIWAGMCDRCQNPQHPKYADYGGRGIRVCKRWTGPNGFVNFVTDMGPRPPGLEIDRRNNNGNYTPGNCRWVTRREQCSNKRNNRMVAFRGRTQCLSAWAVELGWSYMGLVDRVRRMPLESALIPKVKK